MVWLRLEVKVKEDLLVCYFFCQWICLVRVLFFPVSLGLRLFSRFLGIQWGRIAPRIGMNSRGRGIVTWKKYPDLDGPDEILGAVKERRRGM
jgi:hypothetical protein